MFQFMLKKCIIQTILNSFVINKHIIAVNKIPNRLIIE